ncbi:hypothetical protein [Goodfellowiella coeruleoviolacea]|uniref:Uncharacterized protein n=1 Tax=Goodfellowiella coeruleoviolacea TaxID=334858 RepID=A0AAE3GJ27_9PSEU|nr:hypothetical protein [Goodfellowiella coeruleoviolacea]MCP2169121.1 hypothetical protein [Goodfellowiella coeruleoviolacea]
MTDEPSTPTWQWRTSLIDRAMHAIPADRLDPNIVYSTVCGSGLSEAVMTDRPAEVCQRCSAVAGAPPRPPIAEGHVAWWSGPSTGHPHDMSHAFAAEVVNDPARTSYQALGCDYTVLARLVTPFPIRPLCRACVSTAAERGLIPDQGAWRW